MRRSDKEADKPEAHCKDCEGKGYKIVYARILVGRKGKYGEQGMLLKPMFSHPHNKLNLFEAMNRGSIILINTAKDLLKQEDVKFSAAL